MSKGGREDNASYIQEIDICEQLSNTSPASRVFDSGDQANRQRRELSVTLRTDSGLLIQRFLSEISIKLHVRQLGADGICRSSCIS
ncbi:hypothetical protein SKAU_G00379720 [Synaphobranchus kaupii]|uniref:Uncharacterized protein n=1 Tax=Synaphobranchus kaupii TaxID=118154 RepID=A0A9Q1IEJ0_SYNKA|nr:hypothetical protein SKAU_G00379720 [Synaphobranchus kaupii]